MVILSSFPITLLTLLIPDNPTVNGNARGASCVFPFVYKTVVYQECTSIDYDKPWCATTDNYDRDGLWRDCTGSGKR